MYETSLRINKEIFGCSCKVNLDSVNSKCVLKKTYIHDADIQTQLDPKSQKEPIDTRGNPNG